MCSQKLSFDVCGCFGVYYKVFVCFTQQSASVIINVGA